MTPQEYAQEAVDNFKQAGQNPFDLMGMLSRDLGIGGELGRGQMTSWEVLALLVRLQYHEKSND